MGKHLVDSTAFNREREQQLREAAAAETARAAAAEAALEKLQGEHAALITERDGLAAMVNIAEGVRG